MNKLGLAGAVLAGAFLLTSVPHFVLYGKAKREFKEKPTIELIESAEYYRKNGALDIIGALVVGGIAYIEFKYPTDKKD